MRHHSHHLYFAAKIFKNAENKEHDNEELDLLIGDLKAGLFFQIFCFFYIIK